MKGAALDINNTAKMAQFLSWARNCSPFWTVPAEFAHLHAQAMASGYIAACGNTGGNRYGFVLHQITEKGRSISLSG